MVEKRKDSRGRNLRVGEYYDEQNQRYMFRKMVDGERLTATALTLAELRIKENELLSMIDKGAQNSYRSGKMTLNEYFDFWLNTFAKAGRKATTCTNYKSYYNTHIRNTIGKKQIGKIKKVDCQKIINKMIEKGNSHSTMSNLKSCLNAVFEFALDDDVITKNPAKKLQIPQTGSKRREAIEEAQLSVFMDYVRNEPRYSPSYPAFVVLFNAGVRVGEMAALTWEDVNFKNNTLSINKTVNRYRKADYGFTMAVASPKSETSVRSVLMNETIRKELLKHRMQSGIPAARLPYVDDSGHIRGEVQGFVFVNAIGNVWSEPSFLSMTKRIVKRLNKEMGENLPEAVEEFCPHMARHTYTSKAYSAGVDVKTVSQILGHASTSVTMDVYTHLTEEKMKQQEEAVRAIKIV